MSPFSLPFTAFRNPNYRLYFFGQTISMAGTWMQSVVQAWLVYRLTGSAHWLGLISFASQIPAFFLSPLAGVVADRMDRRKLLLWVEGVQMLQAFALAALVATDRVQPWHVAALSALLGVATAFDITTRHAFASDMVGKDALPSAIALNAVIINGSRIAGPALGGVALGWIGEAGCFFLNGVSYLAVIFGLLGMRIPDRNPAKRSRLPILAQFAEALCYVRRERGILRLLALATFVSFIAFPYSVLLPVVAKDILGGDAQTLAWLTASAGFGAVAGVLTLGGRGTTFQQIERILTAEVAAAGCALALLGLARTALTATVATFLVGYFLMAIFPRINATIQATVQDSMRGRVLSLYTMTFLGAVPLGSVLFGWLTDRLGVAPVAIGGGLLCAAVGTGLFGAGSVAFERRNR